MAAQQDVDLLLVDASPDLLDSGRPDRDLGAILRDAPCDVAVLLRHGSPRDAPALPVVVPFGGVEHDWSAVELAAWVTRARGTTLRLVGTTADRVRGRRDASRLLGRASLVVQAVAGIVVEPVLVRGGADGILEAASDASLLVVGMSPRWPREGLGPTRLALARGARVPVLMVRRGAPPRRPGTEGEHDALHVVVVFLTAQAGGSPNAPRRAHDRPAATQTAPAPTATSSTVPPTATVAVTRLVLGRSATPSRRAD